VGVPKARTTVMKGGSKKKSNLRKRKLHRKKGQTQKKMSENRE